MEYSQLHYQHTELNGGRSLAIDIGGFITDWIAVNPGGEVDYGLACSVPLGIQIDEYGAQPDCRHLRFYL